MKPEVVKGYFLVLLKVHDKFRGIKQRSLTTQNKARRKSTVNIPSLLAYVARHDIVISCDEAGMVEYWSGTANDYAFPKVN